MVFNWQSFFPKLFDDNFLDKFFACWFIDANFYVIICRDYDNYSDAVIDYLLSKHFTGKM